MNRLLFALVSVFLLSGSLVGYASEAPSSKESADDAQLKLQSDAWDQAIVRQDRAAIESNMAEDFRQIDGHGNLETKQSFVDGLMDPELTIHPYAVEDFEIRRYGDVALLSGMSRMTGTYKGEDFVSHYRYIDIYVKRDGVWKIVSVQISKIRE